MKPITIDIWTKKGKIAYAEPSGGWVDEKDIGVQISPTILWLNVNLENSPCNK